MPGLPAARQVRTGPLPVAVMERVELPAVVALEQAELPPAVVVGMRREPRRASPGPTAVATAGPAPRSVMQL